MTFVKMPGPHEIRFEIVTEPESSTPDFDDEALNNTLLERSERGDAWAWCVVGVKAVWGDFVGEAWIGECSYESEQEFIEVSGYYDGLMCDSMNDLFDEIEKAARRLEPLVTRDSVDEWIVSTVQEG